MAVLCFVLGGGIVSISHPINRAGSLRSMSASTALQFRFEHHRHTKSICAPGLAATVCTVSAPLRCNRWAYLCAQAWPHPSPMTTNRGNRSRTNIKYYQFCESQLSLSSVPRLIKWSTCQVLKSMWLTKQYLKIGGLLPELKRIIVVLTKREETNCIVAVKI